MPYLFTCPHCQTQTLVDDRYSGQSGKCVTCAAAIQLPDFAPAGAGGEATMGRASQRTAWRISTLSPRGRRIVAAAICLLLIGCAVVAALRYGSPALSNLQNARIRAQNIRNIERIAAALNAYAADHGSYPLPQVDAADGTPLHSWRVSLLPYLGELDLYNQYDMNQPWDSPANQALAQRVPEVYRPPGGTAIGMEAGYSLVIGPGTLFPPAPPRGLQSLGPRDVVDDPGQTLLVVQSLPPPNSWTIWTQPGDLDIRLMQGTVGAAPGREIGDGLQSGAVVATVDGRGHFLDERTSPLTVMALITIAGGEPLADDVLDR